MTKTERCISVASRPGRQGVAMHNAGYRALDLPFTYEAIGAEEIAPVIETVRREGIRGCSVSMPFKEQVIACLETLSPIARQVGAVNTVVNDAGRLIGHNTDATGLAAALRRHELPKDARVQVLGAGGVARAAVWALHSLGVRAVQVAARRPEQAEAVAAPYGYEMLDWDRRGQAAEVVINATSIGMTPDQDRLPLDLEQATELTTVADLVASPPVSRLIADSRARGLRTLSGVEITLEQALDQFALYTGRAAPRAAMADALSALVFPNQEARLT